MQKSGENTSVGVGQRPYLRGANTNLRENGPGEAETGASGETVG